MKKAIITLKKDRKTNSFHDKVKAIKDGSMWRVDIPALLWIHDGDILKIEPINKGLKWDPKPSSESTNMQTSKEKQMPFLTLATLILSLLTGCVTGFNPEAYKKHRSISDRQNEQTNRLQSETRHGGPIYTNQTNK